jgi:hypothetical protein
MPIMAAQGRNDARAAAWLLASRAVACLENPAMASAQATVLNNVYRLLELYRVNAFFGFERVSGGRQPSESISLVPQLEQHVGAVREALDRALNTAFVGQSKEEAVHTIGNVLKGVTQAGAAAPSEKDKAKVKLFFSEMAQHL